MVEQLEKHMTKDQKSLPAIEISIIAPAYNMEAYLERFFSCVMSQSYQGFRLIFVDDCSTDATVAYAQSFGELLGDRFIFLQNTTHAGLSASRNVGLDYVASHQTSYISFLDVDDWFEDNYLEDLYTRATETGVGLCVAGIVRYNEADGRILATEMVHVPRQVFYDASACHELAYINPCSYAKLYRFEKIHSLRFRPVLRSEDTCYLFEALPYLESVAFTNHALYHYAAHNKLFTGDLRAKERMSMHEHFSALMPLFKTNPYALFQNQFETQVFIHSSIGGVLHEYETGAKDIAKLAEEERDWLDATMPTWRSNPFLSRSGKRAARTGRLLTKEAALSFAATLYKRGHFAYLVHAYRLFQRVFKREVRV